MHTYAARVLNSYGIIACMQGMQLAAIAIAIAVAVVLLVLVIPLAGVETNCD